MKDLTINELFLRYPYVSDFFDSFELDMNVEQNLILSDYLESQKDFLLEEKSITIQDFLENLKEYIKAMKEFLDQEDNLSLKSITIVAGKNKFGEKENFDNITIYPSEIIAIVGPTGSGKSRLLADIEWAANKDTQTKRQILINDEVADSSLRFSISNKLVAQLSQNMNFVIDATVYEFLQMHAACKNITNSEDVITKIIEQANSLAGERFSKDTNVTSLSGGQSRALMIADTAILSSCPIVLIDEIENAGIDRKKALELLLSEDKIVLMATHDPLLCLMADKRIVIANGGIKDILDTSGEEKQTLNKLWEMDHFISDIRTKLRVGNKAI